MTELDSLTEIFSYICGQQRCCIVDGSPLPLCQRCFGLHLAAAVTLAWMFTSGIWRRGLPPGAIAAIHATALVAAMLGGLHLPDGGPTWRFACGLWTGHVAAFWLTGATGHLWLSLQRGSPTPLPWRRRDRYQSIAAIALICAAAPAWPIVVGLGSGLCSAAALVGAACLAGLVPVSLLALACRTAMGVMGRTRPAGASGVH